jgi:molybdate transport system substrate-binding protein
MRRLVSVVLVAGLLLAGCGDRNAPTTVTVFAATSLTDAFAEIGKAFETAHPHAKVSFNFAASSALALQLQEGKPADVVALADTRTMKAVSVQSTVFARNRLVIVTKQGNPLQIKALADLASAGVVSLCGAQVPCGAYAAQALSNAKVTIDESHVTRAPNVAAALTAVTDGDAVAAIVYATDAKGVAVVPIPDGVNVMANYPIAVIRASVNARAFVAFVLGNDGQRILRHHGFLKP